MSVSISSTRSFALTNWLAANSGSKVQPKTIEDEFLEIARKSPLERLRDKILEDMKLGEEAIAQMDPEARQAVEDEIKRRMQEALQASTETGAVVDKTA